MSAESIVGAQYSLNIDSRFRGDFLVKNTFLRPVHELVAHFGCSYRFDRANRTVYVNETNISATVTIASVKGNSNENSLKK